MTSFRTATFRHSAARFALLLFCYAMVRLVFVFHNHLGTLAQPLPTFWNRLVVALEFFPTVFWTGLRFDAASLALINAPFFGLVLIGQWLHFSQAHPSNPDDLENSRGFLNARRSQKLLRTGARAALLGFWTLNLLFLWVNLADAFYFPFSGKRSTFAVFALKQDIANQAGQILVHFWAVPILCLLVTILFAAGEWWIQRGEGSPRPLPAWPLAAVQILTIGLVVLMARGGLQRKPLGLPSAYELTLPENVPFVLNTTFTALKAFGSPPLQNTQFLDPKELSLWQQERMESAPSRGLARGRNVVIVILESFGREYLGNGTTAPCYAPFLCTLIKTGISFDLAFANGRTSIESFYSIHAGLPSLHSQPLVTSEYGANRVPGLPARLKTAGYQTLFFHGGRNGTMFFDAMAKAVGIDHYHGLNEYLETGDPSDSDGVWGVYDEPMFRYAQRILSATPEPFFASIFTLSSHNPYLIPEAHKNRFPKGTLPIHESIGYADFALEEFFKAAQQTPWYSNTIFMITADHTSLSQDPKYNTLQGHFRVPLVVVDGSQTLKPEMFGRRSLAQQIDIAPTVMDLLGIPPGMESFFGRSLAAESAEHIIINRSAELFWGLSARGEARVIANANGDRTHGKDPKSPQEPADQKDDESTRRATQALIQSYFEALSLNRFASGF